MSSSTSTQTTLAARYQAVRDFTERIAAPLSPEDCLVQSMPDTSPTRWHMAHTTWFFETFILGSQPGYNVFDEQFKFLFNSYYNSVGDQFPRPQRGLISRPGLEKIREYRRCVDQQMVELLDSDQLPASLRYPMEVGLHHEQQHQELMLTDIKHVLSCNPTLPVYQAGAFAVSEKPNSQWFDFDEGVHEVGHAGDGFAFDNESPRHRVFLHDFSLAGHPVTCGQFIEFIEDGGYERPEHWLSLGWTGVQENGWNAPLYWVKQEGQWMKFTLAGLQPVNRDWPVCHVSYFEADAFARWAGYRLPTEFEWERASAAAGGDQFADHLMQLGFAIHPTGGEAASDHPAQMFGGVWEWTSSSYSAYPGYAPPDGALGEYNGKFMCNQYVLRGGSVATSSDHIRTTYRNFFPPDARWQFSGFRLAK
jgi:ergothioneine biosynthesis protein EgtB